MSARGGIAENMTETGGDAGGRNALFISYAREDEAAADWLAARLTAEGYFVWRDREQMLGGERWTTEVEDAIRNKTFRMLALVSAKSLHKDVPSKERSFASGLAATRGDKDFILPLILDGTSAFELGLLFHDVIPIPFVSWASGLRQLTMKVKSIAAPHRSIEEGRSQAAASYLPPPVTIQSAEELLSNCLLFEKVPEAIHVYRVTLADDDAIKLVDTWACKAIDKKTFAAFSPPPLPLLKGYERQERALWRHQETFRGFDTKNLVSELLRRTVEVRALQRGLVERDERFFFLKGGRPNDKLGYLNANGKRVPVTVVGIRKKKLIRPTQYHLGLSVKVRRSVLPGLPCALVRVELYLTDPEGREFSEQTAIGRRKELTAGWWNPQWLARQMAIQQFLSDDGTHLNFGTDDDPGRLSMKPIEATSTLGIDERKLKRTAIETGVGDES
jgi:hypothetical protein